MTQFVSPTLSQTLYLSERGRLAEHFYRYEFACKCGCGFATVDTELLLLLVSCRDYFGRPITVNSGCRCPTHNKKVGGEDGSYHLDGRAADIVVKGVTPRAVGAWFDTAYPERYGLIVYPTFCHVDSRSGKYRGSRA